MARAMRIEFPGAVLHITSRGNERREIFRDDLDRGHFLEVSEIAALFDEAEDWREN